MTQLERVKAILGLADTSKDALLTVLIEDAVNEFCITCNRASVPDTAQSLISEMVIYRYNRLNTEGLASQSYSGVSESYNTEYPASMMRQLYGFRRLMVM